ncbi:glutathione-disulfide reductase [Chelatococcus sp. SYSU_G07232]|uniref:Glutathione reductase n=1 Tax=Chelatococcus albus TaxID=3047466 RepID=A0ABT7AL97_9HYPH|nr:glutathione-disulfide reductase [Chelatococcus sp. SYSU_G07232]MDJ1159835.1 glutathione-disulfide reductase [Chelatococcus sp. SYSU_G07232]
MSDFDVDLFVIGGGSGGVRAARIAAGHGAKVMIAEEYRFGGTCVIRGCVPKKLFVYASRFTDEFEDAAGYGWSLAKASFDWPTLVRNKDAEIARLERIYRTNLERAGVELVDSRAVIEDPHTVRLLKTGARVRARTILVATGGYPVKEPAIPGVDLAITSNEAFHLEELPRRIIVVGAGYIAVEFAGIFAGLGVQTTLVHRGDKLLRGFDEDLREGLTEAYARRGIKLALSRTITRIDRGGEELVATLDDGSRLAADQIMIATGRRPNTANLGLEAAGVRMNGNGAVFVDGASRSSVPSIYAVGDVTDRVNLTPVAIREGHAFADSLFGGRPTSVDHSLIPTAVFSTPEIGTVGLTESEARERCDVVVYRSAFRTMKATLSGRDERMMMKILVDGASDKVVGVHILGEGAAEMIQLVGIAVTMGATKADFDRTMALHPTAAEELVTMRTPLPRA